MLDKDAIENIQLVPSVVTDETDNRELNHLAQRAWVVAEVRDWRKYKKLAPDTPNPMGELIRQAYQLGRKHQAADLSKPVARKIRFLTGTNVAVYSPPFNLQATRQCEDRQFKAGDTLISKRVEHNMHSDSGELFIHLDDGRVATVFAIDVEVVPVR